MASKTQPEKMISDIEDCVAELQKDFSINKTPINDDSNVLHRLEEKLELVLQHGMKDKLSILGAKKSYWDYICISFSSSKRAHDGLKYVRSMSELKTSLGRGRAFIRFCLMHKCLADTLQSCFANHKTTSEYYHEKSVIAQKKLSSAFVVILYDLNELNFDLTPRYADLDISWPTFARKLFVSSDNMSVPTRNHSISSLHSISSQSSISKEIDLDETSNCDNHEFRSMGSKSECNLTSFNECTKPNQDVCNSTLSDNPQALESRIKSLEIENLDLLQKITVLECQLEEKEIDNHCQQMLKSVSETSETSYNCTLEKSADCNRDSESIPSEVSLNAFTQSECTEIKPNISDALDTLKNEGPVSVQSSNQKFCACCSELLLSKNMEKSTNLEDNISLLEINSQTFSPISVYENPMQLRTITPKSNVNSLLLEMKNIIFDFQSMLPEFGKETIISCFLSRLKNIQEALEINLVENKERLEHEIQNNLTESYIECIKTLVIEQDRMIDALEDKIDITISGNKNLYSKICILRDLLHSYGLLKISGENHLALTNKPAFETATSLVLNTDNFNEDSCSDMVTSESLLNSDITPLLSIFKCASSRLKNLNVKVEQLQYGLESSQALNDNLLSRVQDQELRLKGVTKELEEAQVLVSVLKGQHKKLQSAEGILKYDLQEKRKLLTRLKIQLESTREDWNRVRQKNSKSEAEWQDLRKEFVQRHKQASEESGFIDDKGLEEQTSGSKNVDNDKLALTDSTVENSESYNTTVENKEEQEVAHKKTRLEIMEEQCQLLYSSLLKGSKKSQELDNRLESIYRGMERLPSESITPDDSISVKLPTVNSSDSVLCALKEDCSVTEEQICDRNATESLENSVQSSSEIGSLNSDCGLGPTLYCTLTNSSKIPSSDNSHSIYCNEGKNSTNEILLDVGKNISLMSEDISTSLSDSSMHEAMCVSDYEDFHQGLVSDLSTSRSSSVEPYKNEFSDSDYKSVPMTQVDSLLIKKKGLEKCLEHLGIHKTFDSANEIPGTCKDPYFFQERQELLGQITGLKIEKELLQKQVLELENKLLLIETQLNQVSKQLVLNKASKEQEISALQFQLSTEALKYERALKQFTEQGNGLEDMKQKVSDQEQLIFALEEALTEIRLEREFEKEHQWQELEEIQFALMAREEECLSLSDNLEKLQELKAYSQRDRDNMEAELSRLRSDSRELRKKLIKLVKEKDLLWKRTDQLTHLQKVQVTDRWIDDHEVSNCLGCRNRFSFILRKHHCRLCGRIFCHSCSNNWLLTASSRRRSRVCNECYKLHIEIKKEARRGSDIPCVEDDSEDEAVVDDMSIHPMSNSSFNSEVLQSMTDSIISLPARSVDSPKRNPQLFASAPDLRCIVRQENESKSRPKSMIYEKLAEEDDGKNTNFDVISDEEITKSLSASGSYNNTTHECQHIHEKTISGISMTLTRTTTEIEAAEDGITGELWVNAEMICGIPILCENPPTELYWSFTCDSKPIAVSLLYQEDEHSSQQLVLCDSERTMSDRAQFSLPGLYTLLFKNTSRLAQKLEYTLKVLNERS